MLHEIETKSACDHSTLSSKRQDGSSLQIAVRKQVLDCISLYYTQFQMQKRGPSQVFCMKERLGPHVIKIDHGFDLISIVKLGYKEYELKAITPNKKFVCECDLWH